MGSVFVGDGRIALPYSNGEVIVEAPAGEVYAKWFLSAPRESGSGELVTSLRGRRQRICRLRVEWFERVS